MMQARFQKDIENLTVKLIFYEGRENGNLVFDLGSGLCHFVKHGEMIPPDAILKIPYYLWPDLKQALDSMQEY